MGFSRATILLSIGHFLKLDPMYFVLEVHIAPIWNKQKRFKVDLSRKTWNIHSLSSWAMRIQQSSRKSIPHRPLQQIKTSVIQDFCLASNMFT